MNEKSYVDYLMPIVNNNRRSQAIIANVIQHKELCLPWDRPVPEERWVELFSNNCRAKGNTSFEYKKVIFNPPATIVIWSDNTKTVVKCSEKDRFDFEKGLALCFMKKALGNTSGALNKVLHKETET